MPSIFSKIISGSIPCYKITENESFIAFLDINPLHQGHTLIVPKREVDYIFDYSPQELADMMVFAQQIALALKRAIACKRIGIAVIGMEVPHAHIHLIPIDKEGDMNFSNPKLQLSSEMFQDIAQSIIKQLNR